jgi:hypothetical protein
MLAMSLYFTDSTSEGKKMPKKRAPTGGKLQKPLGKKISF